MARRTNNIEVEIVGEADFRAARREASRAFDRIESDGKDAAQDIDKAFDRIDFSPDGVEELGPRLSAAGKEGADGIADALGGIDFNNIGATGLDQMTSALTAAGPWAAAAGAVAVLFADDLISGFERAFGRRRSEVVRAITTGASEAELAIAGQAAGDAYAAGFGESMPQLQADADQLVAILGDMVDEADFGPMVKQASVLSDILGVDVVQAAELARRSVKQGLADDWQDAFDDMTGVVQEFGATGVEALDVLEEFGPNFARFEVDGGRAVRLVAQAMRDGLVPTIDRSGEAFEEFTTRIIDSDAQDAIEDLGLSFQQIQTDVAAGGEAANRAMQQVVSALLEEEDAAKQAALANVIFGQSFEQVNDKGALLQLILESLTDQTDQWAGASQDATDALEDQQTAWQELQRDIEQASFWLTEYLDKQGDEGFFELGREVRKAGEQLLEFVGIGDDATVSLEGIGEALDVNARSSGTWGDELTDLENDLKGAEDGVRDLRGELDLLKGFGADQVMRGIADATDSVVDSLNDGAGAAVGFNGSIDITTEDGRRLQSQLERVSFALADAAEKFNAGEISADEFRAAQQRAEADIRTAAAAAGLNAREVQGLIDKYLALKGIGPIDIRVTTYTADAYEELKIINDLARNIPRTVTVGASVSRGGSSSYRAPTRSTTTRRTTSSRISMRARGGPASGLTVVGEEGPELLDLGANRGYVSDARTTSDILQRAATSMADGGRGRAGTGATPVVIRVESGGSRLDDVLVEILRKSIANRGGSVQAVLG